MYQQMNITRTEPYYSYVMVSLPASIGVLSLTRLKIDSDYYLPIIMDRYLLGSNNGSDVAGSFLR